MRVEWALFGLGMLFTIGVGFVLIPILRKAMNEDQNDERGGPKSPS